MQWSLSHSFQTVNTISCETNFSPHPILLETSLHMSTPRLIISGLSRSGTNLASNLLAAQQNILCTDFSFIEPRIADLYATCSFDFTRPTFLDDTRSSILHSISRLIPDSKALATGYHTSSYYYGLPTSQWIEYLLKFLNRPQSEFSLIYDEFASQQSLSVFAHRVTGITTYAPTFIEESYTNYWLEITRNSIDRFYSAKRAHSILPLDSFQLSSDQALFAKTYSHNRFLVYSYEDIVSDPSTFLEFVSNRLDLSVHLGQTLPITPDGAVFRGNSSEHADLFFQDKSIIPIYSTSIGQWNKLNGSEKLAFNLMRYSSHSLQPNPLYIWPIVHFTIRRIQRFFSSRGFLWLSVAVSLPLYILHRGYRLKNILNREYKNSYTHLMCRLRSCSC